MCQAACVRERIPLPPHCPHLVARLQYHSHCQTKVDWHPDAGLTAAGPVAVQLQRSRQVSHPIFSFPSVSWVRFLLSCSVESAIGRFRQGEEDSSLVSTTRSQVLLFNSISITGNTSHPNPTQGTLCTSNPYVKFSSCKFCCGFALAFAQGSSRLEGGWKGAGFVFRFILN